MKKLFILVLGCIFAQSIYAQSVDSLVKYRRSSLYSVLIKHSSLPYGNTIDSAFMAIPTPDKFNNHELAVKSFESSVKKVKKAAKNKKKDEDNFKDIQAFMTDNAIAKGLVANWFARDEATGYFDMNLIAERGNYDASQAAINEAKISSRGLAMLQDAGQELIGKTFVLVNDITFIDHGANSEKAKGWLKFLGGVASAVTGTNVSDLTDTVADAVGEIDGFKVNITSYLYRLVWNDDILNTFYNDYYTDSTYPVDINEANKIKFDNMPSDDTGLFKLEYIGQTTSSAANLSSKSFAKKSKEEQMLKVCTRAIDKAIVELQREYEEFKVNVPIYKVNEDGTVDVQIGLKEGINDKSQFDVLMPTEVDGRTTYEKIGKIEPIKGKIWDNRFGAIEDAEALASDKDAKGDDEGKDGNANLTATTFKVLSGANKIVPGCLVREVTIKRAK